MTRDFVVLPLSTLPGQMPYIPRQMLEDLLAVGGTSTDQLDRLAADLQQESGIPMDSRLEELVARHIPEASLAESILRALVNLRPEELEETVNTLRRWREANSQNASTLPSERLEVVRARLSQLIQNYPSLVRYRKAQRLRKLTGRVAASVDVVCDLRPVFDQSRTVVEGLIPLTILRVGYRDGDGSGVLEVLLSGEDLEELAREVERAKQKLGSLRESVGRWVPNGWAEPE